jgi:carbon starvation protein CstA
MITEGMVALIWAAVSSWFFFDGGAATVGADMTASAPTVVTLVSKSWLGTLGAILALLGVVAAPITSGDTALRSGRLIIADALHFNQTTRRNRLAISIPMFLLVALILWYNIADANGFNTIWRYFGWANQTLSVFTLWAITVFLTRERGKGAFLITLIPACFMTSTCLTYICIDKIGLHLPVSTVPYLEVGTFVVSLILFFIWRARKAVK